jgi:hypothetical protein
VLLLAGLLTSVLMACWLAGVCLQRNGSLVGHVKHTGADSSMQAAEADNKKQEGHRAAASWKEGGCFSSAL